MKLFLVLSFCFILFQLDIIFRFRLWKTDVWQWSLMISSTYNLVLLTLERYIEIIHPIWHKIHIGKEWFFIIVYRSYAALFEIRSSELFLYIIIMEFFSPSSLNILLICYRTKGSNFDLDFSLGNWLGLHSDQLHCNQ